MNIFLFNDLDLLSIIFFLLLLGIIFSVLLIIISFFNVWLRALLSGASISILKLIAMKLRRVPYSLIVDSKITAIKAGIKLSSDQLEAHYLAEGNLLSTIQSLIAAEKAGINLNFSKACAIDLATKGSGKTVLEAVKTSVNPKVIDCPNIDKRGKDTIDAVSKDGIQVKVKARVTVRSNLKRFVGGAQEETIIARVGEGIVTTIGLSESYKDVLENPDKISQTVLNRGLDSGTAFEILSIDIADIDVGNNIGASLQEAQAEANKNMAQAKAEIKRAAAVALEQEMIAKAQEMKAKLIEEKAKIPLAIADSLKKGNMGVMDYYKFQNIQSDTKMRNSISNFSKNEKLKK